MKIGHTLAKSRTARATAGGLAGCLVLVVAGGFLIFGALGVAILGATGAAAAGTACGNNPAASASFASATVAQQAGFNGIDLITAVAIAGAESSWDPNVADHLNSNGTYDRGEWQINSTLATGPQPVFGGYANALFDWTSLQTATYNAQAAFNIYTSAGNKFTAWTTYTNNTYLQPTYLAPATTAVGILLLVEAGKAATGACPPPPPPSIAPPLTCGNRSIGQGWGPTLVYEFAIPAWAKTYASQYNNQLYRSPDYARPPYYFHTGIDISCRGLSYAPVDSIAAGTVSFSSPLYVFGSYCGYGVRVNHGSYSSFYDHLDSVGVIGVGATVAPGQQIGRLSHGLWNNCIQGDHLHFQINFGFNKSDDPCNYFPGGFIPTSSMTLRPLPCWNPAGYAGYLYRW